MADIEKNVTEEVTETKDAKPTEAKDKKAAKAAAKKDKVSFGKRIKKALKEFKAEFKKIVWSSKRSTFSNTALVIVIMVIVAVVIGLLDLAFSNLITWIGTLV